MSLFAFNTKDCWTDPIDTVVKVGCREFEQNMAYFIWGIDQEPMP